jgi:hypothetical protein
MDHRLGHDAGVAEPVVVFNARAGSAANCNQPAAWYLRQVRRPVVLGLLAAALVLTGCVPGAGRSGPDVSLGSAAIPLADIRADPQRFVGRAITTRGTVVTTGRSSGSPWIDLVDTKEGGRLTLLLAATAEAGAFEEMIGKTIELMLSVDGTAALEDGRPAVRVTPLQIIASIRRFDEPQELTSEMSAGVKAATESMKSQRATMFRDPGAQSEEITVTGRHLDPDLQKPLFERAGPSRVERSGTSASPAYLYSATAFAVDGARQDVTCRFRVENGGLRSVSYDETVRKPDGSQASTQRIDFVNGKGFDKVSAKSFPWPRNIYAAPCLPFAMRGFPLGKAAVVDFFLWSDYDPFSAMFAAFDGEEPVAGPSGPVAAARIRMNLNDEKTLRSLALPMPQAYDMARDIIGQMRPVDSIFWIASAAPHDLVRFEGPTGAPGSTRVVVERVKQTHRTSTIEKGE